MGPRANTAKYNRKCKFFRVDACRKSVVCVTQTKNFWVSENKAIWDQILINFESLGSKNDPKSMLKIDLHFLLYFTVFARGPIIHNLLEQSSYSRGQQIKKTCPKRIRNETQSNIFAVAEFGTDFWSILMPKWYPKGPQKGGQTASSQFLAPSRASYGTQMIFWPLTGIILGSLFHDFKSHGSNCCCENQNISCVPCDNFISKLSRLHLEISSL